MDAVIYADSTWQLLGEGKCSFRRPDGSRGVVHCTDQQDRCALAVIAGADRIVPCSKLAWLVSQGKRQFRVDTLSNTKSFKERQAVVVDLVSTRRNSVFSACDFCPFCGVSIKTRFADEAV